MFHATGGHGCPDPDEMLQMEPCNVHSCHGYSWLALPWQSCHPLSPSERFNTSSLTTLEPGKHLPCMILYKFERWDGDRIPNDLDGSVTLSTKEQQYISAFHITIINYERWHWKFRFLSFTATEHLQHILKLVLALLFNWVYQMTTCDAQAWYTVCTREQWGLNIAWITYDSTRV